MSIKNKISVFPTSHYIESESNPNVDHYVFGYTITIQNLGSVSATLLTRHWLITDGNGNTQEVQGEGVVGKTPLLKPGEQFRYTSAAVLETPVGIMKGNYRMISENGRHFAARVPQFTLSIPRTLH
jgi:ApaG protein